MSAAVATMAARPQGQAHHHQRLGFEIWHLVGPHACGKSLFARQAVEVITSRGQTAVWLESGEMTEAFEGNPARVAEGLTVPLVILLEANDWELGEHPRYWMQGDRVIDLTHYATSIQRRPGLDRLLVLAMLKQPTLSMDYLISQAKTQYCDLQRSMLDLSGIATQRAGGAAC